MLAREMRRDRDLFIDALRTSTGFVISDCEEIFDSSADFVAHFHLPDRLPLPATGTGIRDLKLKQVPWGTVAAVLPQNAFLSLSLIVMLNALATGNRVIMRMPTGSIRIAALLTEACRRAGTPANCLSIVLADAREFIDAWSRTDQSVLLHFFGSSDRGLDLLSRSWRAGKPLLFDGSGNTWVYVDADQDPEAAAELLWTGAIRYNGETCTSINGAIIHPDLADLIEAGIRRRVDVCRYGCDQHAEVGPLFGAKQAGALRLIVEGSHGVEHRAGNDAGCVFAPTLVVRPSTESDLVREGLFGPAIWISPGTWEDFERLWANNRYPLCAGVLSHNEAVLAPATQLANASRIVLNGDPSIEDASEPWGAYPRCGSNPVGDWASKYLRTVQVDAPADR
jgi:acyl-CoA reductase-like NAD-dependent aldehyde dehydrogenase